MKKQYKDSINGALEPEQNTNADVKYKRSKRIVEEFS